MNDSNKVGCCCVGKNVKYKTVHIDITKEFDGKEFPENSLLNASNIVGLRIPELDPDNCTYVSGSKKALNDKAVRSAYLYIPDIHGNPRFTNFPVSSLYPHHHEGGIMCFDAECWNWGEIKLSIMNKAALPEEGCERLELGVYYICK